MTVAKPIETLEEYLQAVKRMNETWDAPFGTPEWYECLDLSTHVWEFEERAFPKKVPKA